MKTLLESGGFLQNYSFFNELTTFTKKFFEEITIFFDQRMIFLDESIIPLIIIFNGSTFMNETIDIEFC